MTGIQAIERLFPSRRMKLKQVEKIEFEYIRHGTQTLIANWHIAKGQVLTPSVGATRTEEDFVKHIAQTIDTDPDAGWIFIVDQLNIHKSESLVRWVAQRCQMEIDLGIKEKSGILQSITIFLLSQLEFRLSVAKSP
jgi:putative transposase